MKRSFKNLIMISLIVLVLISIFLTMNYAKKHITSSVNSISSQGNSSVTASNQSSSSMGEPPAKPDGTDNNAPSSNSNQTVSSSSTITYGYYIAFGIESLIISILLVYLIMSKFNKNSFKDVYINNDKKTIGVLLVIILTSGLTYLSGKITSDYFLNSSDNSQQTNNSSSSSASYSGATEITADKTISEGTYESTTSDENAILVSGDIKATLSNIEVTKSGDSSGGDNTSFYGINSGIVAKGKAQLVLKNIKVTTNAVGANGVFSYGGSATTNNSSNDGTTITISDSTITTTKDNSGGIMTTGGGIMKATNLTVNTAGTSSAAIRTDRGGGTVTVDGGTYKTTGQGSPAIYSTADVTVSNATLIAKTSEGAIVEGKNSITLNNCTLTSTNSKLNGLSTTNKNIFIYQSMSGDSDTGSGEFTAKNSTITTNKGDTIYITNTTAKINLENNTFVNNDSTGNFLRVQKDSWGTTGSNGGDVTLTMTNQKVEGNIVIDSISELAMTMKSSSSYTGTINGSNTAKSIKLVIDSSSKIKLTGDSYVSSLEDSDSTYSNINFNGHKLYVNGKAIN